MNNGRWTETGAEARRAEFEEPAGDGPAGQAVVAAGEEERPAAEAAADEPDFDLAVLEKTEAPVLVTVSMFGRQYQIKSDKPNLVRYLAAAVNREAEEMRVRDFRLGPGRFDWPVQVAFRLALSRHAREAELADLEARVEDESALLTARIDAALTPEG